MSGNNQNQRRGCGQFLSNVLTAMFFTLAFLLILGFAAVLFTPELLENTGLPNLFNSTEVEGPELPTQVVTAGIPSPTHTPTPALGPTFTPQIVPPTVTSAPTDTPEPTLTPSATSIFPTKTPTNTPTPTPTNTPTETPVGPTQTPSPTLSAFPFTKSDTSPFFLQNYANNAGCNWMGVAGEVLDLDRRPVIPGNYKVHVWTDQIDQRVIVGGAPAYSPSGWEQFLAVSPVVHDYNLQLESNNGTPVSQVYTIQSRATCAENLIRFDFVQNH